LYHKIHKDRDYKEKKYFKQLRGNFFDKNGKEITNNVGSF